MPTNVANTLCAVADVISEVYAEMPIQQIRLLFLLSKEGECYSDVIMNTLGMTSASLSRSVRTLSVWLEKDENGQAVKRGLDLVETRQDMFERRKYIYLLTPKGKALMAKVHSLSC
jgi:DNA-binding MarR family transcriptional regulator